MEKIIGITAEYNPFHQGHLYQLGELRRIYPDAGIVAVLSTDFLQRGIPSLMDKWQRARAAALCGVDLVLELPAPFCCNNAGVFASAAVAIFRATNIVNAISFGMEEKTELVRIVSDILVQEPPAFKAYLKIFLKKGYSYAESRAQAADRLCPGAAELLARPNNTLAVAYVEAMLSQGAKFELLPILRSGPGYHDTTEGPIMSASGIRQSLMAGREEQALDAMPAPSARVLSDAIRAGRACVDTAKLWECLRLLLARSTPEGLAAFAGMDEGIEHRYLRKYRSCSSYEQLVQSVATRRHPRTRVQRQLAALLLNFTREADHEFQRNGPAYIRPLAMNRRGRQMLGAMRKNSTLPVITKPAALKGNDYAQKIITLELRSTFLWETLLRCPDWHRELCAVPQMTEAEA